MSKALNSPSARLLQSSRLFSIPRPLPQPALDVSPTGAYKTSDTATLPYPTQQAITTPASSHYRGDFGLKRPLPGRATRTSTPHIKVNAHDNFAHITDFGSAANHTQTEAKWREMQIPMMKKEPRTTYSGTTNNVAQSVYDDNLDNTDRNAPAVNFHEAVVPADRGQDSSTSRLDRKRWKYEGPYVVGMSEGEFQLYLMTTISERKAEFKEFLLQRMLDSRVREEERNARAKGTVVTFYRKEELRRELEANYETEEKRLRDDHTATQLASDLTAAICDFLDLPGIGGDESGHQLNVATSALNSQLAKMSETDKGFIPPTTHPGAGLSHLRTNAYMENHPVYGPQARRLPVLSRVLMPRNSSMGTQYQAIIGVGGIVTRDPVSGDHSWNNIARSKEDKRDLLSHYADTRRMGEAFDLDLKGGNKFWVHPEHASVDDQGLVKLEIVRGDAEAIAVKTNRTEPIHEARAVGMRSPGIESFGRAGGFGTGLPGTEYSSSPRSRPQGYDEELGRRRQQGRMDHGEAAAQIRNLWKQHEGQR